MRDYSFVAILAALVVIIAGIAFTVWVMTTPDLPLWAKLLILKN